MRLVGDIAAVNGSLAFRLLRTKLFRLGVYRVTWSHVNATGASDSRTFAPSPHRWKTPLLTQPKVGDECPTFRRSLETKIP